MPIMQDLFLFLLVYCPWFWQFSIKFSGHGPIGFHLIYWDQSNFQCQEGAEVINTEGNPIGVFSWSRCQQCSTTTNKNVLRVWDFWLNVFWSTWLHGTWLFFPFKLSDPNFDWNPKTFISKFKPLELVFPNQKFHSKSMAESRAKWTKS